MRIGRYLNFLEDNEDIIQPYGTVCPLWDIIKIFGFDNKAGAKVFDDPSNPIVATTYDRARSVAPASTEIHAANYDHAGTGKIIHPEIFNFNVGLDITESLLISGEDSTDLLMCKHAMD